MSFNIKRIIRSCGFLPKSNIVIVGTTRFSVDPSSIITNPYITDIDRRRSAVLRSDRLSKKMLMFKNFTIPSLAAASLKHNPFYHLVAFSSSLPAEFRNELDFILKENSPWLRLIEVLPGSRMVDLVRGAVHALGGSMPTLNFRIDDDDALCPDFIEYAKRYCLNAEDGSVISFDLGYYIQRISENRYLIDRRDYPKIAIGLGIYQSAGLGECVFDLPVHTKIDNGRVIHIRDNLMWIRTIHDENDSGTRIGDHTLDYSDRGVSDRIGSRFSFLPPQALYSLPVTSTNSKVASRALFQIQ